MATGSGLGPPPLRRRNDRASGSPWCPAAGFVPLGVRSLPTPTVIPPEVSCAFEGFQERSALLIGWIEGDIQWTGDGLLCSPLPGMPINSGMPGQAETHFYFR